MSAWGLAWGAWWGAAWGSIGAPQRREYVRLDSRAGTVVQLESRIDWT